MGKFSPCEEWNMRELVGNSLLEPIYHKISCQVVVNVENKTKQGLTRLFIHFYYLLNYNLLQDNTWFLGRA